MTVINVNFEGVEAGMNYVHIPEGDYALEVKKVVQKTGEASGKPYLLFSLKVTAGNDKGINKVIAHSCSLTKNALWNLRNLLEAAGKTIPAKAIKIDLDKLIGLKMAGTVIDDEYDGKKKSIVSAFFPTSELSTESGGSKKDEPDVTEAEGETETAEGGDEEAEELFA